MNNRLIITTVLLLVILQCDAHKPRGSFLDGLLTGAQGIGSKVQEVITGFTHHGHGGNRPWQQKPPGGGGMTEPETETIVVIVEKEQPSGDQPIGHQQYGPPSYNYNAGYNKPDFQNKPHNGYNSHYNGNYNSGGGHHHHHHHHHHHNKPGYEYMNPNDHYNNGNNYMVPNYNQMGHGHYNDYNKPHNHHGYEYNNPNNQINNENSNSNNYGPHGNQQKPTNDVTNKVPDSDSNYGTVYDPTKEIGANNNPNTHSQNNQKLPTPKPDDKPLLIPLNPNQYTYGGDKIDINAPKRETDENKKPVAVENTDDGDGLIDIRFGE